MKYLKKFFVSFVLIVAVMFTFSACGKKNDPLAEEQFETDALSLSEYAEIIEDIAHTFTDGFTASITTTYADGTTDSGEQSVLIGVDRVQTKLKVSGAQNYTAYLNDGIVYYDDGESKLYAYVEDFSNSATENFKTRHTYDYMLSAINPTGLSSYKIYDGTIFEDLEGAFGGRGVEFTIKKLYNDVHTNLVILCSLSDGEKTTFTLKYTYDSFTEIEIKIKNNDMVRNISLKAFDGTITLPDNLEDDFENERAGGETVDDNWSPD